MGGGSVYDVNYDISMYVYTLVLANLALINHTKCILDFFVNNRQNTFKSHYPSN